MRNRIMNFTHNGVYVGDPGSSQMFSTLSRSYHWLNMLGDVHDYVSNCPSCLRTKCTK